MDTPLSSPTLTVDPMIGDEEAFSLLQDSLSNSFLWLLDDDLSQDINELNGKFGSLDDLTEPFELDVTSTTMNLSPSSSESSNGGVVSLGGERGSRGVATPVGERGNEGVVSGSGQGRSFTVTLFGETESDGVFTFGQGNSPIPVTSTGKTGNYVSCSGETGNAVTSGQVNRPILVSSCAKTGKRTATSSEGKRSYNPGCDDQGGNAELATPPGQVNSPMPLRFTDNVLKSIDQDHSNLMTPPGQVYPLTPLIPVGERENYLLKSTDQDTVNVGTPPGQVNSPMPLRFTDSLLRYIDQDNSNLVTSGHIYQPTPLRPRGKKGNYLRKSNDQTSSGQMENRTVTPTGKERNYLIHSTDQDNSNMATSAGQIGNRAVASRGKTGSQAFHYIEPSAVLETHGIPTSRSSRYNDFYLIKPTSSFKLRDQNTGTKDTLIECGPESVDQEQAAEPDSTSNPVNLDISTAVDTYLTVPNDKTTNPMHLQPGTANTDPKIVPGNVILNPVNLNPGTANTDPKIVPGNVILNPVNLNPGTANIELKTQQENIIISPGTARIEFKTLPQNSILNQYDLIPQILNSELKTDLNTAPENHGATNLELKMVPEQSILDPNTVEMDLKTVPENLANPIHGTMITEHKMVPEQSILNLGTAEVNFKTVPVNLGNPINGTMDLELKMVPESSILNLGTVEMDRKTVPKNSIYVDSGIEVVGMIQDSSNSNYPDTNVDTANQTGTLPDSMPRIAEDMDQVKKRRRCKVEDNRRTIKGRESKQLPMMDQANERNIQNAIRAKMCRDRGWETSAKDTDQVKRRRRGRKEDDGETKKTKLYEQGPLIDQAEERKRRDAIRAKACRDRNRGRMEDLQRRLDERTRENELLAQELEDRRSYEKALLKLLLEKHGISVTPFGAATTTTSAAASAT